MRSITILSLTLLAIVAADSLACAPPQGYRIVDDLATSLDSRSREPNAPAVRMDSLRRGFDDGMTGTCSDLAELTLVVEDADSLDADAYFVEAESGPFPQGVLPIDFILPIELETGERGFVFRWLDLHPGANSLEAIDAMLAVRRVSQFGLASDATRLRIVHPGGPLPPKAYAGIIATLHRITEIAIALLLPLFLLAYLRQRLRWKRKLKDFQDADRG